MSIRRVPMHRGRWSKRLAFSRKAFFLLNEALTTIGRPEIV
jgi:hypothetical protein